MRCWQTPGPNLDAGPDGGARVDARGEPPDVGTVPLDTGVREMDSFVLAEDASGAAADAAGPDAAIAAPIDSFTVPEVDGGPTLDDARSPTPDGFIVGADAALTSDAGGPCAGGPLLTFFRDADGDGHGAAAGGTMMRCAAGGGYVASSDDCDDGSVARYPGNPERCNGVDDDCDLTIDGAPASAACSLANATAACVAGSCEVVACTSTAYGDCDGADPNGCETDVTSSAAHCGLCGTACEAADRCVSRACEESRVVEIALGSFGCARRANGRVACWGTYNAGVRRDFDGARTIEGVSAAISIAVGRDTACAVQAGGRVLCWGENGTDFRMGISGIPATANPPTEVPGIVDAAEVASSGRAFCARRTTGQVLCWGFRGSTFSMLGDGVTTGGSSLPVLAVGVTDAVHIVGLQTQLGANLGFCAVGATGGVACWGQMTGVSSATPVTPAVLMTTTDIVDVAMAGDSFCVARTGGATSCFDVTAGAAVSLPLPATPPPAGNLQIGGFEHGYCMRTSTAMSCWGANDIGQLGRGTVGGGGAARTPMPPMMVTGPTTLATTTRTVCATNGGTVWCWGSNSNGELALGGSPRPPYSATPVAIPAL